MKTGLRIPENPYIIALIFDFFEHKCMALNYKHLRYFWVVAQEGSIAKACERLHLTSQTVSAQIQMLETALGESLFDRGGRRMRLTDVGRTAYEYADAIFQLGNEMTAHLRTRNHAQGRSMNIGITDVLPKLVAYRLLEPLIKENDSGVRLVCHEGGFKSLLGDLGTHQLDVVLADSPVPSGLGVRAYNHALGSSGISFLAESKLAGKLRSKYPQSLNGAPFLMPSKENVMAMALQSWFESIGVAPRIVGEFDDSALVNAFAQGGHGVLATPTIVEKEVCKQYGLAKIGREESIREEYYIITAERRINHPAITSLTLGARQWLTKPS